MARGVTFGDMLREARMQRGMDIHAVARRLRLRADILTSIEDADFAALPPSGYTRNMINSYARLVGLDPREVSARYLDELHLFETGRSRIAPNSTSFGGRAAYGVSRASQSVRHRSPMVRRTHTTMNEGRYRGRYETRDSAYDAPPSVAHTTAPRAGYASSSRMERPALASPSSVRNGYDRTQRVRGGREVLRAYDSYAFPPADVRTERGANQSRRPLTEANYATSPYAGLYSRRDHGQKQGVLDTVGNVFTSLAQRLPLVIGIVAVIVLLIVIVSFIGGGDSPAPDETPTMPISGLTDTSNQNADAYNTAATEPAPTSAKFSFSVSSGSRSWMQIEVDGKTEVDETVQGPVDEEYEFTDSVSFRCGNVSPVTIMVDGKEVKPTYSERDEEYVYNVTFSSILSEWQRAHAGSAIGSGSTSSGASSSGSASSSSSSSGSSSSSSNR